MTDKELEVASPANESACIADSRWLVPALLALGVILRTVEYLHASPFWGDEIHLARHIIHRSLLQLLEPLTHFQGLREQVAPTGFVLLEKLVLLALGPGELSFRFIPWIASVASVFLFWRVTVLILPRTAMLPALFLFDTSYYLIYFASELKQYSTDVMFGLLFMFLLLRKKDELGKWYACLGLGITGALLFWFSHPLVFFLAGTGTALFATALFRKKWQELPPLSCMGAIWLLSIALQYHFILSAYAASEYCRHYHAARGAFWQILPISGEALLWPFRWFIAAMSNPGGFRLYYPVLFMLIAGVIHLFRKKPLTLAVLIAPCLVALVGAALQNYPATGRTWLFATPTIILLIASGFDILYRQRSRSSRYAAVLLMIAACLLPSASAVFHLSSPRKEKRPLLERLLREVNDGDVICGGPNTVFLCRFYLNEIMPKDVAFFHVHPDAEDIMENITEGRRVWLLTTPVDKSTASVTELFRESGYQMQTVIDDKDRGSALLLMTRAGH